MSRAVLISIRPKWCEKIADGEKTIEVRRTRPKLETPFKVYIYCTAGNLQYETQNGMFCRMSGGKEVIGEFICDRVTDIFANSRFWLNEDDVRHTCLTADEIRTYANGANMLYGWHISNLKIYDTPKELIEFYTWKKCKSCNKSGYESTACIYDENCIIPAAITKAPQSWRYVEELK